MSVQGACRGGQTKLATDPLERKGTCTARNTGHHEQSLMGPATGKLEQGTDTGEMQEAHTHQEGKVVQDTDKKT